MGKKLDQGPLGGRIKVLKMPTYLATKVFDVAYVKNPSVCLRAML